LALLLTSCFIPEKFIATLRVNRDFSYTFEYAGTIAFGPAIGEIATKGALPRTAEDEMRAGTTSTFKKEDGFDRASYEGKGRWMVHFKRVGTVATKTQIFGEGLPIVTLSRTADGGVSVTGMTLDLEAARQLKSANFVVDGRLDVTTDMTVTYHNATETPKLQGLVGQYGWKISSERLTSPRMILKP